MTRLAVGAILVSALLGSPGFAADDPAPVGATYTGILKRFGLPDNNGSLVSTHAIGIRITKRDGDKFVGEYGVHVDEKIMKYEIEGTVNERGSMKFTVTKPLSKESGTGDVLGRVQVVAVIKDGTMTGSYTLPNSANVGPNKRRIPRFGKIELKLKTD